MSISLRKFSWEDIPLKVGWINDPANNQFLHYNLPLEIASTEAWFARTKDQDSRLDMTILLDGIPVGILGLLQIDRKNESAELYITIGEPTAKGKGIAGKAMELLMRIGFEELGMRRISLMTETGNTAAVRAYEKFGFVREGCLRNELRNRQGVYVSRYVYSMLKDEFEERYGKNASHADIFP